MNLYLHIFIHFLFSLLVGFLIWKIWEKPLLSFIASIISGVFIDLDHLIDYFLSFGFNFNLNYFLKGYQFQKFDKMYVLFHGWEYAIILILVSLFLVKSRVLKTLFLGLALGIFFHLWLDVIIDRIPIKSYLIINRINNNFDVKKLVTPEHFTRHLEEKEIINFNNL